MVYLMIFERGWGRARFDTDRSLKNIRNVDNCKGKFHIPVIVHIVIVLITVYILNIYNILYTIYIYYSI